MLGIFSFSVKFDRLRNLPRYMWRMLLTLLWPFSVFKFSEVVEIVMFGKPLNWISFRYLTLRLFNSQLFLFRLRCSQKKFVSPCPLGFTIWFPWRHSDVPENVFRNVLEIWYSERYRLFQTSNKLSYCLVKYRQKSSFTGTGDNKGVWLKYRYRLLNIRISHIEDESIPPLLIYSSLLCLMSPLHL